MIEICVDSYESVVEAIEGGAHRLELCSSLLEGGLTPTLGFLKVVKSKFPNIHIFAMLRPRGGNDFIYTQPEMQIILSDMVDLENAGADGFVFGALTVESKVDREACEMVRRNTKLPLTFHRAFDQTDPKLAIQTIEEIISLGYSRILTSGFMETAIDGIDNIIKLISAANNDIIVMPGAGVNIQNADDIIKKTGCKELHGSAKTIKFIGKKNDSVMITNREIVRELVNSMKRNL